MKQPSPNPNSYKGSEENLGTEENQEIRKRPGKSRTSQGELDFMSACFKVFRNTNEEEEIKVQEERKHSHSLSSSLLGGCGWQKKRRWEESQLLSEPTKDSSSASCKGPRMSVTQKQRVLRIKQWSMRGLCTCKNPCQA